MHEKALHGVYIYNVIEPVSPARSPAGGWTISAVTVAVVIYISIYKSEAKRGLSTWTAACTRVRGASTTDNATRTNFALYSAALDTRGWDFRGPSSLSGAYRALYIRLFTRASERSLRDESARRYKFLLARAERVLGESVCQRHVLGGGIRCRLVIVVLAIINLCVCV